MNEYIKIQNLNQFMCVRGYARVGSVGSWCRCARFGVYHVPSLVWLKTGPVSNH